MGPLTATTHEWYAATTSPVALPVKPCPVAHQAQPTVWKQLSHDAARHTGQPDVYQSLNGQLTAPLERDPTGLHVLVVAHHPGHNATITTVSKSASGQGFQPRWHAPQAPAEEHSAQEVAVQACNVAAVVSTRATLRPYTSRADASCWLPAAGSVGGTSLGRPGAHWTACARSMRGTMA